MGQVVENRLFILMIRRPPRSTLDRSSAASDVYKRQDLFFRLNVVPLKVPALRERPADIPLLVAFFLSRFATKFGRRIERIDRQTMEALVQYNWPGNVRELQNVIERAVVL